MKDLIGLFVELAAYSVIPLVIYLIGYAAQSQRISKFGIGVGKLMLIWQAWFFTYAICYEVYCAMYLDKYSRTMSDEVFYSLTIGTAVIYGLIVIGLVRRNKLTFFK